MHEVLPELFSKDPVFYKNMRIQALAHGIHKLIVKHRLPELMYEAFETLPQMAMTPHRAFQQEILGNTCECLLSEMTDKISANMILPYPRGPADYARRKAYRAEPSGTEFSGDAV